MWKAILSLVLPVLCILAGTNTFALEGYSSPVLSGESTADYYQQLMTYITGDWQQYGQMFTTLQGMWFWKIFLAVISVIPVLFLIHYLIIGAKQFEHDGEYVYFFNFFNRVVHFFAALSFSLLVITGLAVVFGSFFGGGGFVRVARYVHLIAAMAFILPGLFMFLMWFKDMLPELYDISWMLILGGYLSKKKKPVPAGKFNAGQKMYFWFATAGGGIMAYTGYLIWGFGADIDSIRVSIMVHNILAAGIVAFYLTHVYMSVFAIAGSLESMKTGYKPKEEVDILHSRYEYE